MRTGCSYMGQHDPHHLALDLQEMADIGLDDVLLAAQEIDFLHRPGKIGNLPPLAHQRGMRAIAIFWGALNLFGGGKSSHFLLEHPEGQQIDAMGQRHPKGCYNNPECREYIISLIDRIAELGFDGYFIDEPRPLECFCPYCERGFAAFAGSSASLHQGQAAVVELYRRQCVRDYIQFIVRQTKKRRADLETSCCLMPNDRMLWTDAAAVDDLDNLGTDIYWANNDTPLDKMDPLIEELANLCRQHGKLHHQWLQAWKVQAGREPRIVDMGRRLLAHHPDQLYAWAYRGQVGTYETCEQPELAWSCAKQVLAEAKT